MKKQYRMLFAFAAILLAVSLACNGGGTPTAAPIPTSQPVPTKQPQSNNPIVPEPPALNNPPPSNGNSSELVVFTDENNLLSFEIPGDWSYEQK